MLIRLSTHTLWQTDRQSDTHIEMILYNVESFILFSFPHPSDKKCRAFFTSNIFHTPDQCAYTEARIWTCEINLQVMAITLVSIFGVVMVLLLACCCYCCCCKWVWCCYCCFCKWVGCCYSCCCKLVWCSDYSRTFDCVFGLHLELWYRSTNHSHQSMCMLW